MATSGEGFRMMPRRIPVVAVTRVMRERMRRRDRRPRVFGEAILPLMVTKVVEGVKDEEEEQGEWEPLLGWWREGLGGEVRN